MRHGAPLRGKSLLRFAGVFLSRQHPKLFVKFLHFDNEYNLSDASFRQNSDFLLLNALKLQERCRNLTDSARVVYMVRCMT